MDQPSASVGKSSAAVKLVHAAALAAALVPLASVPAHASSCTYFFSGGTSCTVTSGGFAEFDFGTSPYTFFLKFNGLTADLTVNVNDVAATTADFDARAAVHGFGGYSCDPLGGSVSPGDPCRDFTVTTDSSTRVWTSYTLEVTWTGAPPANALLHAIGGGLVGQDPNNVYNEDMCRTVGEGCMFSSGSGPFGDPGISSGDTDFSVFDVALAPVPEPASVLLLVTGMGGLLYRKRRAKQPPLA